MAESGFESHHLYIVRNQYETKQKGGLNMTKELPSLVFWDDIDAQIRRKEKGLVGYLDEQHTFRMNYKKKLNVSKLNELTKEQNETRIKDTALNELKLTTKYRELFKETPVEKYAHLYSFGDINVCLMYSFALITTFKEYDLPLPDNYLNDIINDWDIIYKKYESFAESMKKTYSKDFGYKRNKGISKNTESIVHQYLDYAVTLKVELQHCKEKFS